MFKYLNKQQLCQLQKQNECCRSATAQHAMLQKIECVTTLSYY